jgi:uncharacterized protein YjbJ (UPF0337 family)
MTWTDIEANWEVFQPLVRRHWFRLTPEDLEQISGHRDMLAWRIAERYGLSQRDALREIEAWTWLVRAPRVA